MANSPSPWVRRLPRHDEQGEYFIGIEPGRHRDPSRWLRGKMGVAAQTHTKERTLFVWLLYPILYPAYSNMGPKESK